MCIIHECSVVYPRLVIYRRTQCCRDTEEALSYKLRAVSLVVLLMLYGSAAGKGACLFLFISVYFVCAHKYPAVRTSRV